jgi:predicted transcriptional regulator
MEEVTPIEIEFLAEANNLPEEYIKYFLRPLRHGKLIIPGKNSRVGDLVVRIFRPFISVQIGNHTEARFSNGKDAVVRSNVILFP